MTSVHGLVISTVVRTFLGYFDASKTCTRQHSDLKNRSEMQALLGFSGWYFQQCLPQNATPTLHYYCTVQHCSLYQKDSWVDLTSEHELLSNLDRFLQWCPFLGRTVCNVAIKSSGKVLMPCELCAKCAKYGKVWPRIAWNSGQSESCLLDDEICNLFCVLVPWSYDIATTNTKQQTQEQRSVHMTLGFTVKGLGLCFSH